MARAFTFSREALAFETLRIAIVVACALTLIVAGRALPF